MRLWLRARRLRALIAVAALVVVAAVLAGSAEVSMPALGTTQGLRFSVVLLAPLALSSALAYALDAGDHALERVSCRPVGAFDAALVILLVMATLGAAGGSQAFGWSEAGVAVGRNALGYAGLTVLIRRFLSSEAGAVAPAALAVLLSLVGGDPSGNARWWAWPLAESSEWRSWAIAVALFAAGSIALLLPARRTPPANA